MNNTMNNDLSPQEREMQKLALTRFYGLLMAVVAASVVALIWFFNIPGLQDPETGRLPEVAGRALALFPAMFIVGAALIVALTNRKS